MSDILVAWGPGEIRLALVENGRVVEFAVDRGEPGPGSVLAGRVVDLSPKLDAAFVDIGQDRPGFLPGAASVTQGQSLTVRLRAEARGGKGAALELAEGAVLFRVDPLSAWLARRDDIERVLVDDPAAFADLLARHGECVQRSPGPAFDLYDAEEVFAAALDPVVRLPCGGRVLIEETAALTAIDVDSAGAHPAQANREAVKQVARQLRLRGIGGQAVVDFVSGKGKGPLYRLADALKAAVAEDPVPTHVFGVSGLGLVELTRERRSASLSARMLERGLVLRAEAAALDALRRTVREAAHRPGRALALVLAPEVAAALPQGAVTEAEGRIGRPLTIRRDPARRRDDPLIEEVTP